MPKGTIEVLVLTNKFFTIYCAMSIVECHFGCPWRALQIMKVASNEFEISGARLKEKK